MRQTRSAWKAIVDELKREERGSYNISVVSEGKADANVERSRLFRFKRWVAYQLGHVLKDECKWASLVLWECNCCSGNFEEVNCQGTDFTSLLTL